MANHRHAAGRFLAKLRQMWSRDPLVYPLGRASDHNVDEALGKRRLTRADLFRANKTSAPHRHRFAQMLTAYHFSPRQLTESHWPELKLADHMCAHCRNKQRCDRWLRKRQTDDAPKRFCPNVTSFEKWRRDYIAADLDGRRIDGDAILEAGLTDTRALLRQIRLQDTSASSQRR